MREVNDETEIGTFAAPPRAPFVASEAAASLSATQVESLERISLNNS